MDTSADLRQALICAECEREADETAIGWRGYFPDMQLVWIAAPDARECLLDVLTQSRV